MKILLRLLAFTLFISGCSDTNTINKELYVGSWTIIEATQDNINKPTWNGLTFELIQLDENGGTYEFPNSPEINIWNTSGTWTRLDISHGFLRDELIGITYDVTNDQLRLSFFIGPNEPTCTDFPCPLYVIGQWYFNATKN